MRGRGSRFSWLTDNKERGEFAFALDRNTASFLQHKSVTREDICCYFGNLPKEHIMKEQIFLTAYNFCR